MIEPSRNDPEASPSNPTAAPMIHACSRSPSKYVDWAAYEADGTCDYFSEHGLSEASTRLDSRERAFCET